MRVVESVDLTGDDDDEPPASTSYAAAATKRASQASAGPAPKRRTTEGDTGPLRLLRTEGVTGRYERGAVSLREILGVDGWAREAPPAVLVSNYMISSDWLLSECPELLNQSTKVHVLYDGKQSRKIEAALTPQLYPNISLHAPRLSSRYGTHHTKMVGSKRPAPCDFVLVRLRSRVGF